MGIMPCHRNGCENVMCDRYSHEHGFICNDCFQELVDSGFLDIELFMETPKKKEFVVEDSRWDSFDKEFPIE